MNALAAFLWLATLAASAPFWPDLGANDSSPSPAGPPADANQNRPAELISPAWTPLALGPRETRFSQDLPGRISAFSTPDGRTVIVRQLRQPTRKLHPAADCLRAVGYSVEPRPVHRQSDGVEWSELRATRGNDTLRVRERILGADGRRWTDISAWYWSAALGRASGPWWAVTELAPD